MKKQMILSVICLLLSSYTTSTAECTQSTGCPINTIYSTQKCGSNISICPTQKIPCCKKIESTSPQNAIKYQNYINRIKRERATVYNALNLSEEQIKTREELLAQNSPTYEQKFEQLKKESYKLKALKGAGASDKEISDQKKLVKNIKKDIDNLLNDENKKFKKCLTREQRSKYAMIKKLEKNDYKKVCHKKDLYKANPKMVPFGGKCPCTK